MLPRHRVPILSRSSKLLIVMPIVVAGLAVGCAGASTPGQGLDVVPPASQVPAATNTTPPPTRESTPTPSAIVQSANTYSNDRWGFCFAFPEGFTQQPYNDAVEVVGPFTGADPGAGLLWMDVRDAQGQTAQQVADQDLAYVPGLNPDRSTVMLGGELALVLDGMPGQNLVRRVYVVHQESLYTLTFSPTRSDNATANDQMEALFATVTGSWAWSPCASGD